jgi:hypothetical protein
LLLIGALSTVSADGHDEHCDYHSAVYTDNDCHSDHVNEDLSEASNNDIRGGCKYVAKNFYMKMRCNEDETGLEPTWWRDKDCANRWRPPFTIWTSNGNVKVHEGKWGTWRGWYRKPLGSYLACGLETKTYKKKSDTDDGVGVDALRFTYCATSDWKNQKIGTHGKGYTGWGEWGGKKMCPEGYFINSVQIKS